MSIVLDTLRYLAVIAACGWAICEILSRVIDWALNVEEGSF